MGAAHPGGYIKYYMNTAPKKKKVFYLITKSNWGGAQRYVYDLATHLDRSRYEPVVALGGNGTLAELLHHADIRTISIDALTRDIDARREWAFIKTLWHILREERPDILHVNSSKAGGIGTLLGRLRRVPRVIFTAHGWAFNEDRPWWQRTLIKFLHWLTVLLSHRTIAVSHAIVAQMNWPGARRKMKVIHPGRTIGAMYPSQEARHALAADHAALRVATGRDHIWVGTIAELHPIKRLDVLIDSVRDLMAKYPKIHVILIGEGHERAGLEAQIAAYQLQDRIHLLGGVPEAARFLHAFSYFILPSKSESYGYVLHEAGLARLPVIATNVGGIRDIITAEESGLLVPPDDTAALSAALERLLQDRELANALRTHLHTQMSTRTVEKMVTATTALYSL